MKIGIYTPIGRLDKYGYQYHYETILDNFQNFANEVLLISTSRKNEAEKFKKFSKIKLISNKNTWFTEKNNQEIFSHDVLIKNDILAFDYFQKNNFDIFIHIHINQYIPEKSAKNLRKIFQTMLAQKKPYACYYKKYQIKETIFDADFKMPWILNLKINNPYRVTADSITNQSNGEILRIEKGDFKKHNQEAIIDILADLTIKDAKEKWDLTINELRKLSPTEDLEKNKFNQKIFSDYLQNKTNQKQISNDGLDLTGKMILNNFRENFISQKLLENYSQPKNNFFTRCLKKLRK